MVSIVYRKIKVELGYATSILYQCIGAGSTGPGECMPLQIFRGGGELNESLCHHQADLRSIYAEIEAS